MGRSHGARPGFHVQDLIDRLPADEVVPAGVLAERLGVTRPTRARLVTHAGDRVVRLTRDTAITMGRLHAFGRLIGNSDMHQGNLGFELGDHGPLPLVPVYDMLPMSLAPSRTGVLRTACPLEVVAPTRAGDLAHLQWAAPLAHAFWARVAVSRLLRSATLRALAAENARRVQAMGQRFS